MDKALHFTICLLLGATAWGIADGLGAGPVLAIALTVLAVAVVGFGKELFDKLRGGKWSWGDLLFDGLGLAAGLALCHVTPLVWQPVIPLWVKLFVGLVILGILASRFISRRPR